MKISILGCGWIGLPLAQHLIEHGHTIKGSTTSQHKLAALKKAGVEPYLIKLTPELENPGKLTSFWDADLLFLNIPSRTQGVDIKKYHPRQIQSIITAIRNTAIKRVVFASSTGVYPSLAGLTKEEDTVPGKASRDSGEGLLIAEEILLNNTLFQTTVIRFGGLIGYNRNPIKYLAGKKNLERANAPVNLIHRDDCIAIITQIIEDDINSEIFNAVCDDHPARKEYYKKRAAQTGLEPPHFKPDNEKRYRVVNNEKLKRMLNYTFKVNKLK